ncbi:MAG: NADH-quinone oxidoreductase subunit NuoF [Chloroflexota bacterium]
MAKGEMKRVEAADIALVREILGRHQPHPESLVSVLSQVNEALGCLTPTAMEEVASALKLPTSHVYSKATFYSLLSTVPKGRYVIRWCENAPCHVAGAARVLASLCQALGIGVGQTTADGAFSLETTSCLGLCDRGPAVSVNGEIYGDLTPEAIPELLQRLRRQGVGAEPIIRQTPLPADGRPIVLANYGRVDPERIEDYLAQGGYSASRKALTQMAPEQVVGEIKRSGLRGRGGAGFPTGLKWEFTAKAPGQAKYIVANADESEPGTFKDRLILEGDPHRLLEAMTIAGYAVGAAEGYIYVRGEYSHGAQRLERALKQAREQGCLGTNLFGSGFSFDIRLHRGAGAYVCGEETALLESIEGRRGEPRPRPPYPPTFGLWGQPTVINNVETLANVPPIIANGADWYRGFGTERSPGTKVFTLSGRVARRGAVEAPMGITLRQVIEGFGGGLSEGRAFKLAQVGGSSGALVPPSLLDVPMDYDSLAQAGATLGSGAVLAADDRVCVVDLLRATMRFFAYESCGKCTPCRLGTARLYEILSRLARGEGQASDLEDMDFIARNMATASYCGLGQAAPTSVLSALKHFRAEVEAHARENACPAGVCPS